MQRTRVNLLWFGLAAIFAVILHAPPVAGFTPFGTRDPDVPRLECNRPRLDGVPQFIQTPPGTAVYRFSGNCNEGLTFRVEGKWTPTAGAGQANATEAFDITGYEPFLRNRAPGGKIYVLARARCNKDPWLNERVCMNLGAYLPDDIRAMWKQLEDLQTFPWTHNVLSARDKTRLLAEYNRVNKIDTAPAVATSRLPNQLTTLAPRIVHPTNGQSFIEARSIPIRIAPPANSNVTTYLVQVQRKDARGNWILHTNLPVGASYAHGAGYTEFGAGPPPGFLSTRGSWRMNAQATSPTQSAWSNWVEFSVAPGPVSPAASSKTKGLIVR